MPYFNEQTERGPDNYVKLPIFETVLRGINIKGSIVGTHTFALPGVVADVVDETTGESIEQGQGLLVLKRPWPGMLRTLYGDDERYVETYFSRFGNYTYLVGDATIHR
jgi:acetyl-CoA synthetase